MVRLGEKSRPKYMLWIRENFLKYEYIDWLEKKGWKKVYRTTINMSKLIWLSIKVDFYKTPNESEHEQLEFW